MPTELLAQAARLTQSGGTRRIRPAAPGRRSSFVLLTPGRDTRVSPRTDSGLAAFAAAELEMVLGLRHRRSAYERSGRASVPTVVPRAVCDLVELGHVTAAPVDDDVVIGGDCPITWLKAFGDFELGGAWVDVLREMALELQDLLSSSSREVDCRTELDRSHEQLRKFKARASIAARDDRGVTGFAHGELAIAYAADGFRPVATRVSWLTCALEWTGEAERDWPRLPADKGRVVIQAQGSAAVLGVFRDLITPRVWQDARRCLRCQRVKADALWIWSGPTVIPVCGECRRAEAGS